MHDYQPTTVKHRRVSDFSFAEGGLLRMIETWPLLWTKTVRVFVTNIYKVSNFNTLMFRNAIVWKLCWSTSRVYIKTVQVSGCHENSDLRPQTKKPKTPKTRNNSPVRMNITLVTSGWPEYHSGKLALRLRRQSAFYPPLPFLAPRQPDKKMALSPCLYWKATNTDRYLDFKSHHHPQHKHSVVHIPVMDRSKNIP